MPEFSFLKQASEGVIVSIKVSPKASKSEIVGEEAGELKVRIAAVPEKGKANLEVLKLLAKSLKIPRSQMIIVSGESSRHKKILIKNGSLDIFQGRAIYE